MAAEQAHATAAIAAMQNGSQCCRVITASAGPISGEDSQSHHRTRRASAKQPAMKRDHFAEAERRQPAKQCAIRIILVSRLERIGDKRPAPPPFQPGDSAAPQHDIGQGAAKGGDCEATIV